MGGIPRDGVSQPFKKKKKRLFRNELKEGERFLNSRSEIHGLEF
jgi:hypothetical protein